MADVEAADAALRDSRARPADPDPARRGRGAVREGLRDPGGAEPRLHDGSIARSAASSARSRWTGATWWARASPTLLATVSAVDPIYVDFAVAEADYCGSPADPPRSPGPGAGTERQLELFLADDSLFPHEGPGRLRRPGGRSQDRHHRRARRVPESGEAAAAGPVRPRARRDRGAGRRRAGPPAGRAGAAGSEDGPGRGGR